MSKWKLFVRILPVLLILSIFIPAVAAEDAPATQPATGQDQMEKWWGDLKDIDPQMSRALLGFSDRPEQTVAFFKDKLVPLILTEDDLNKLVADLGSDDETVWKAAAEKLKYFDPRLAKDLQSLMDELNEPVSRNRMIEILSRRPADSLSGKNVQLAHSGGGVYQFEIRTLNSVSSWWVEGKLSGVSQQNDAWVRATRAVVILEHIGTPDAIVILKDMASGNPEAGPTKTAQEALVKLGVAVN
ncbi:MAG TPA: hypothetical protein VHS31_04155 [Tepidisphaeraceae bacterium]|jgi:hypothetical protein|nr:hypothetical protein [Tepidisphaeraceae bacterium]